MSGTVQGRPESAIADTTMDFIAREPALAKRYTKAGFDGFWKAVAG